MQVLHAVLKIGSTDTPPGRYHIRISNLPSSFKFIRDRRLQFNREIRNTLRSIKHISFAEIASVGQASIHRVQSHNDPDRMIIFEFNISIISPGKNNCLSSDQSTTYFSYPTQSTSLRPIALHHGPESQTHVHGNHRIRFSFHEQRFQFSAHDFVVVFAVGVFGNLGRKS